MGLLSTGGKASLTRLRAPAGHADGEGHGAARWIEVAPPDRNVILVLFTPDGQQDRIGTFSNVLFDCDDVLATHKELAGRGVGFAEEPSQQFWGWWATFKDPDGNTYGLGQRGE